MLDSYFINLFHRTSVNYLLMNLAVADITVATFFVPRYILFHTFTHPDELAGTVLCKLLTAANMGWTGAVVSIVTLVAIAIERYYAVVYPLENIGKLTTRKLKVCSRKFVSSSEFNVLYFSSNKVCGSSLLEYHNS